MRSNSCGSKSVKVKYPKGEIVWLEYSAGGVPMFLMTSKEARDFYFLYKVCEDGSVQKLGRAKTPTELERKFQVNEALLGQKG